MTVQERNRVIALNERLDPPSYSPDIQHECENCLSNDVEWQSAIHDSLKCNSCQHEWSL